MEPNSQLKHADVAKAFLKAETDSMATANGTMACGLEESNTTGTITGDSHMNHSNSSNSNNSHTAHSFNDSSSSIHGYLKRSSQLRRVDQRVNLMDPEAATYEPFEDEASSDEDSLQKAGANEHTGSDIFAGRKVTQIQEGLQSLRQGTRLPRAHSLPDLHEASVPEKRHSLGMLLMDDSSSSGSDSSSSRDFHRAALEFEAGMKRSRAQRRLQVWTQRLLWIMMGIVVILGTTVLVGSGSFASGRNSNNVLLSIGQVGSDESVATTRQGLPATDSGTAAKEVPSTTAGAVSRRQLVLEHVLETVLLPELQSTNKSDREWDLTHPAAQKAMAWMTGYDPESMRLLDHYHYHHHTTTAATTHDGVRHPRRHLQHSVREDPQRDFAAFGPHVAHHVDVIQDDTDPTRAIVEHYVLATSYFETYPEATVQTTTCQDVKR